MKSRNWHNDSIRDNNDFWHSAMVPNITGDSCRRNIHRFHSTMNFYTSNSLSIYLNIFSTADITNDELCQTAQLLCQTLWNLSRESHERPQSDNSPSKLLILFKLFPSWVSVYLYFLSAPAPWPYLASQIRVIMRQHCPALPCIAPTMSHPLALGSNNSLQSELSDPLLSSMHCSTPICQNHIKQFCLSSWEFDLEKIISISIMILLLANLQIKSF